ncbi:hypothetical protein CI102_8176 [Trichoderma harzianum]|nr:hypothetical protein CI102_8176 [Trichoderma harzianum]
MPCFRLLIEFVELGSGIGVEKEFSQAKQDTETQERFQAGEPPPCSGTLSTITESVPLFSMLTTSTAPSRRRPAPSRRGVARAQDEGKRAARHHAQIAKFTKYRDSDHDAAAQLLRDANKLPEQMLTRNTLNYQRHHAQIAYPLSQLYSSYVL